MTDKVYAGQPVHHRALNQDFHRVGTSVTDGNYLPIYSDLIEGLAEILKRNVRAQHQNVVCVTGGTGSGKSHFAIKLAMAIDPHFSFANDYIYSARDLAVKLGRPPSSVSPVSLFDEGSVVLNSMNFQRKGDKNITTLFDTMRSRGWTTIICIPKLRSLNNRVRDDHLNYIVGCGLKPPIRGYQRRGFVQLLAKKDMGMFSEGNFFQPMCWGVYTPLPAKISAEYEEIKKQSQDKFIAEFRSSVGMEDDDNY